MTNCRLAMENKRKQQWNKEEAPSRTEKLCGAFGYRLCLDQRSANVFCKGPEGKYFKLCQAYNIFANARLCHHQVKIARDNTQVNGHGSAAIKWYWQKQVAGQTRPAGCSFLTPRLHSKHRTYQKYKEKDDTTYIKKVCTQHSHSAGKNSRPVLPQAPMWGAQHCPVWLGGEVTHVFSTNVSKVISKLSQSAKYFVDYDS